MKKDNIPKINLIKHIDNSKEAIVCTKRSHNFFNGQVILINIPTEYGCALKKKTKIKILDSNKFKTDIDTSQMPEFIAWKPPYYRAYTPAQCIPNIEEE